MHLSVLMTTSTIAVVASTSAWAQTTGPSRSGSAPSEVEEVVVTGSRIIRDGFEAPTPVTVTTAEELKAAALTFGKMTQY